ncbi:MAG TPA: 4,5-dihydroxyphthalate decarboxylase [Alphaproteobacteria bacterium]|jgi:4,5-dihydroxyphthalate decarboxylase
MSADKLRLSLAICEYDHTRDFTHGPVAADGIELDLHVLPIAEIFQRFTRDREWDVSEMSLGMYVSLLSQGDTGLTAIPVFTSRMFRLSSFYARVGGDVKTLADLRGKRVGYPDWMHTAGIWARGYLAQQMGIALNEIEWVQAGVNAPGLQEILKVKLPPDVKRSSRPDSSLDAMLLAGEIDAALTSHPLASSHGPSPRSKRVLDDFIAEETAYGKASGLFPIMHVIAIRSDVYARNPWIAEALYAAFDKAKGNSLARMRDSTISRYPYPWMFSVAERATELFGEDFWPYGVAPNRATLEAFLAFCLDQGVAHRPVGLSELFAPGF